MANRRNIAGKLLKTVVAAVMAACVLFVCVPQIVDASKKSDDPTENREGFAAYLYDNTTGLPTPEANAIVETPDGFIWIGSYGGLIRYDGNTFERFDSRSGIASVNELFVDDKGDLWVGTNDSGVGVIDRFGNIKMYNKRDGLPSASIRAFAQGPDGKIYIGTTQGVAYVDTNGSLVWIDDSLINNSYIMQLELGSDGVIYCLTKENVIFTLENGSVSKFFSSDKLGIDDGVLRAMATDPKNPGYIYVGVYKDSDRQTGSKIWYGKLETDGFKSAKKINVKPLIYINYFEFVGDDLWVCANNGIGSYKGGDEISVLKDVPMTASVEDMIIDYQGNLWFASSKQGIMKVVKNHFTNIFDKYDIEKAVVNSTCYYKDMLFIGTDSGLVVVNNDGKLDRLKLNSSQTASGEHLGYLDLISMLEKVKIRSIIKDSKDRIWISTFGDLGLIRYDNGNVITFGKEEGLPESQRIRTVYECKDGSYLVACTGGVAVIRDDKVEKVYGTESGISNIEILTVAEGDDGEIIAGSDGDGIYILGESGVEHINTDNGLMSDVVMRIKKSQNKDVYWIVTSNSLAYMTKNYEVHTIKNFPYSNNFDMYENSKGDVWVLSSNGIYVISSDSLIENQDISPVFYGIDNGLPIIANANSYSCVTDEGILYIAGSTGVAKVDIEGVFENVSDVKMTVPYVEADGVKIYPDSEGKFTVPYSTKKITIYPYICSYNLMNPNVTYKLEGFGSYESTVKRSELSSIDYTNLKGGTYVFHLTLADSMGHSNETDVFSIVIVKQKAVYEHLWFMILAAFLGFAVIALLVYLYVRRKTKALLKKQEENKTLIREIVEAFAKTIDMKDKYTNGHSKRVADYTVLLARELGYDEETVEKYYNIALLHDIGKIGVPGEVLNKEGRLTDDEYHTIQSHTVLGYNVLKDISIMPELSVGAESHHERPDGKGYPQGLKADEIPRVAQIIGVADAFDAMYSNRPYRGRMNFEKVVSIISGARGTQMAEDVVDAFLRIVERGGFRAPDDIGGGTTEDIDNIHKRLEKESKEEEDKKDKGDV